MKIDEYLEVKKKLREYADTVEENKRPSYTAGSTNVLENFTRDGALQGLDPMQNWLGHFLKQVAAVCSYVRNPDIDPSETLISRMADVQTYATLGLALAKFMGRKGTGMIDGNVERLIKMADESIKKMYHVDSDYGH
jgi:hypothetical protein